MSSEPLRHWSAQSKHALINPATCTSGSVELCHGADAFDRRTLLGTTIAAMLYPEAEHRRAGEDDAAFTRRIRILIQTECLAPLRKAAKIPEARLIPLLT